MSNIKIMSENLANKIAAGEVVEKCASIVKELVENSIDAKADSIKIDLINGGLSSIKISDNGVGMDSETLKKLFSPFFTTKNNGTGLGVCLSKEIVEKHGGSIEYLSKKNIGTKVIIKLPL